VIATVLIVAGVCGLALSFLGVIHHCWLGESFNDDVAPVRQIAGESRSKRRAADYRFSEEEGPIKFPELSQAPAPRRS
jgi:hypothetical protein